MPDSTNNFSIDTVNGPVGATTVTRDEFITSIEQLNYADGNIRSIDNLSGTPGFVQIDGNGGATSKTFLASTGLEWTNANGEGGNPTIRLGNAITFLQSLLTVETNAITNNYVVSIIAASSPLTYALPTPTIGVAGIKIILNKNLANSNVAITSTDWEDYPFDSSYTLSSGNFAIFAHDTSGKWFIPAAQDSTLT
jgi:hypothetical protein